MTPGGPRRRGVLDLSSPAGCTWWGPAGPGMSAIATVLAAMGHRVTGSDLKASPVVDRLAAQGIAVAVGHRAENVGEADVVTFSPAVRPDNPELVEARAPGHPGGAASRGPGGHRRAPGGAWRWPGRTARPPPRSMLSLMLVEAGLRPSFLIGADVNEIGTNAVWDEGEWLVLEADESYGTFQALRPEMAAADQRGAGPPRPLRHVRRAARGLRRLPGRAPPAAGWWGPTTRWRPARSPARGRTASGWPTTPTTG